MRIPIHAPTKTKTPASVVFDIGSGSVAAGVILSENDMPTRILFGERVTLSNEDRDEARLSLALTEALRGAGTAVLDRYAKSPFSKEHGPVKEVSAMVHAPWVHSITRDSHITLTAPVRITKDAIEKANKEGSKEAAGLLAGHTPFEQTVVRVELNGYPTALPVGKTAGQIRVLALESSISTAFQNAMIGVIAEILPGRTPTFHSSMYAYSTVVRELTHHSSSYTFLDIASEASACSVIASGSIAQQGSIPAGTRTLIRAATAASGSSPENIYSMIRMLAEGTCSDAACEEVAKILETAEPVFMRAFGEAFSAMITESRLPNALIISIHPTIAPWAESFFQRLDFSQFTLTGKPFAVEVLSSRVLTDLAVFGTDASPDTGLAIIAALVHIRHD